MLGAWGVDPRQRRVMLRVYASLLTGLHLPAISDVEFGHMRGGGGGGGGGPAPALEVPTAEYYAKLALHRTAKYPGASLPL